MTLIENGDSRFFGWADYMVFSGMLLVSALIGIYHGLRSGNKKGSLPGQNSTAEFLTANGELGTVPVAISMLASFLSSITLMGQPAEVYLFGPQLWVFGVASFLAIPLVGYVFIPFYHKLRLTSAYQYFGQRFNRKLQLLASILFTAQMVLFLALVLYAPALALYQVTGLNTDIIVTVMYIVVIFYTTIGGMKAVVWTDCFQVVVLYTSMLMVLVKGTLDIGGFSVVFERNVNSGRSQFLNWNPDPTDRYTIWGAVIGAAFLHMAVYGANQLQVQRYLTVRTVQQARKMLWINAAGWSVVVLLTVYAGMLIFAKYYDCDPLSNKEIAKPDQLFPLYVMETLGDYPGFPGLFVAGIFSAGLSTVSTGLNSLAAIWFAEMDGTEFKARLSDRQSGFTVKLLALGFGLISFSVVFLVPYMGGLAPVAMSLSSFFAGSLFGVFLLGMFVPWANSVGATAGLILGVGVVGWMTVGSQVAIECDQQVFTVLPTSLEGCAANITQIPIRHERELAFVMYRVSFLWYSMTSTIITVTCGILVSAVYNFFCSAGPRSSETLHSPVFKPTTLPKFVSLERGEENLAVEDSTKQDKLLLGDGIKDAKALKIHEGEHQNLGFEAESHHKPTEDSNKIYSISL